MQIQVHIKCDLLLTVHSVVRRSPRGPAFLAVPSSESMEHHGTRKIGSSNGYFGKLTWEIQKWCQCSTSQLIRCQEFPKEWLARFSQAAAWFRSHRVRLLMVAPILRKYSEALWHCTRTRDCKRNFTTNNWFMSFITCDTSDDCTYACAHLQAHVVVGRTFMAGKSYERARTLLIFVQYVLCLGCMSMLQQPMRNVFPQNPRRVGWIHHQVTNKSP